MSLGRALQRTIDRKSKGKKTSAEEKLKLIRGLGDGLEKLANNSSYSIEEHPRKYEWSSTFAASMLADTCPQRWVYNYWIPETTAIAEYGLRYYGGFGTFLHDLMQTSLLPATGAMRGNWYSKKWGEVSGYPSAEQTVLFMSYECGDQWEYTEERMWDPHWRISGRCDGIVSLPRLTEFLKWVGKRPLEEVAKRVQDLPVGEEALLEIKTIGKDRLSKIKTSDDLYPRYRMQATIYQEYFKLPKTVFLYVARDNGKARAVIYEGEETVLDEAYHKMARCLTAVQKEELPRAGEKCTKRKDAEKFRCPVADACFCPTRDKRFREEVIDRTTRTDMLDFTGWSPKNDTELTLVTI